MNINFGTNNINLDINEKKAINAEVGATKVVRYEKNHANLANLDYENSGHTGFQKAGNYIEEEKDPTVPRYIKNITENDIYKWNNKAEVDDIPNVSNFITKDVSNLTNYYNKDYIDNTIGNIETLLGGI